LADIDTVPARHRLRARIGRVACMPAAGARGIDLHIEADPRSLGAECGFRQGGAADIAHADEQDG